MICFVLQLFIEEKSPETSNRSMKINTNLQSNLRFNAKILMIGYEKVRFLEFFIAIVIEITQK
jgi:hypothetical protein